MSKLPSTLLQYFKVWPPRTPGLRNKRMVKTDDLFKGQPLQALTAKISKSGGRCSVTGRITSRHRGGGIKHDFRLIDFDRSVPGPHKVLRLEEDPNRSARIALIQNVDTKLVSYILAAKGIQTGDVLFSGPDASPDPGNVLPLNAIPPGTLVHCLGLRPHEHGGYAKILRTSQSGYAQVKMASGEIRFLPVEARATIGTVSNPLHKLEILGTAGANRRRGRRPNVRGVAMNPCDHPMGGNRGGRSIPSTSPWGKITKGVFTVKKHKDKFIIKSRPTTNARRKQPVPKSGKFSVHSNVS